MHTEKEFICRLCSKTLKFSSNQGIKQPIAHVRRKKHIFKLQLKNNSTNTVDDNEFNEDLARVLISNNIPLSILNKTEFKSFIEKYTNRSILSRSTFISTIIPDMYE